MESNTGGADRGKLDSLRILVVEDEALVAMALGALLEAAGAEVLGPAQTLDDAIRIVEREPISAAILDIAIAGREIWPVAQRLAARSVPIVFYTGLPTEVRYDPQWPMTKVVHKPARDDVLVAELADVARGRSGRAWRDAAATPPRR